jgi:hypothetical protein
MPPETEVVSCPACKHLVRIPADWLGQPVQCPECQAKFKAPVKVGDRLTEPELLSGPTAPAADRPRGRTDLMLLFPAFGLMLTGFASLAVNGWLTGQFSRNPDLLKEVLVGQFESLRTAGLLQGGPENPDERRRADEQLAASAVRPLRIVIAACGVVAGLVFYGGLSIVRGRHYRMAQLGCVLAVLNIPHLCCVPGGVFGVWGLLMLRSDEAREHFGRSTPV